jgi:hypothetical protein
VLDRNEYMLAWQGEEYFVGMLVLTQSRLLTTGRGDVTTPQPKDSGFSGNSTQRRGRQPYRLPRVAFCELHPHPS